MFRKLCKVAQRLYEHRCSGQKTSYGPRRGDGDDWVQVKNRTDWDRMPRGERPMLARRPALKIERSEPACRRAAVSCRPARSAGCSGAGKLAGAPGGCWWRTQAQRRGRCQHPPRGLFGNGMGGRMAGDRRAPLRSSNSPVFRLRKIAPDPDSNSAFTNHLAPWPKASPKTERRNKNHPAPASQNRSMDFAVRAEI